MLRGHFEGSDAFFTDPRTATRLQGFLQDCVDPSKFRGLLRDSKAAFKALRPFSNLRGFRQRFVVSFVDSKLSLRF